MKRVLLISLLVSLVFGVFLTIPLWSLNLMEGSLINGLLFHFAVFIPFGIILGLIFSIKIKIKDSWIDGALILFSVLAVVLTIFIRQVQLIIVIIITFIFFILMRIFAKKIFRTILLSFILAIITLMILFTYLFQYSTHLSYDYLGLALISPIVIIIFVIFGIIIDYFINKFGK